MKKLTKILLISILTLIPASVLADVGMPEFKAYEAYITNPEGAICYDWQENESGEKLPYSETDTYYVIYEYKIHGKDFALMSKDKEDFNSNCYVNEEDIKPKDFKFNTGDYTETSQKYYVWEKGLTLKKGPANVYKNVSNEEIPVGTVLTVKYQADDIWGYVIYKGQAGWIDTYQTTSTEESHSKVASLRDEKRKVLNYNEKIEIYDAPVGGKVVTTVPANTELTYQYYYGMVHMSVYYVTYNGKSGWTRVEDGDDNQQLFFEQEDTSILVLDSSKISLYETPTSSKPSSKKLEDGKEYQVLYAVYNDYYSQASEGEYMYSACYYIKVGTERFFIMDENDSYSERNEDYLIGYLQYHKATKDIEVYDGYTSSAKKVKTISKGSIFATTYQHEESSQYYYYISGYGWIKSDNSAMEYVSIEDAKKAKEIIGLEGGVVETTTTSVVETTKKSDDQKKNTTVSSLSTQELIMVIISGVVILSLTVVVVLVLINKRKKKKQAANSQAAPVQPVATEQVVTPVQPVQTVEQQVVQPQTVVMPQNDNNGSDNNVAN